MEDMIMNATLLFTNDWEYKVYMAGMADKAAMKQAIGIFVTDPNGNKSDLHKITRSKLFTSKSTFDFLFDFEGGFDRQDIDAIKSKVMDQLKKVQYVDLSERVSIDDAHRLLSEYVNDHYIENCVYIDEDGYCNIEYNDKLPSVIAELELGYKRLELVKMFKILDLLKISGGRVYDFKKYDRGEPYWTLCFIPFKKDENSNAN
jgi:hypothetical protein